MDYTLRRLVLLFALALPCHAQGILAPILFGTSAPPVTGTNITTYSGNGNQSNSGVGATVSVTYTCASTSNTLVVFGGGQGSSLTLSDTGGEAAGATNLGGDTNDNFWIMGCASGANTITMTAGSGGVPSQTIQVREYGGITMSGDGPVEITNNASAGTSCAVAATSSQVGDLAVVVQHFVGTNSYNAMASRTFSQRMWTAPGGINTFGPSYFAWLDNLYAPNGSVSYTGDFPSNGNNCYMALIKGVNATSPGFYPVMAQSNSPCTGTSTDPTFPFLFNVATGSTVAVDVNYNGNTTPTSVTDSLGTSYTLQNTQANGTANEVLQYTGVTTGSGADTIKLNGSGWGNDPCTRITEYVGLAGTTTDHGGQTSGSATMTWSQNISNNNSIVDASCSTKGLISQTFGISGPGYSLTSADYGLLNSTVGSWAVVGASGTSSPTLTMGNNSQNVCGGITLQ